MPSQRPPWVGGKRRPLCECSHPVDVVLRRARKCQGTGVCTELPSGGKCSIVAVESHELAE